MSEPSEKSELLKRADDLQRSGRPVKAEALYRLLLAEYPEDFKFHERLVATLCMQDRIEDAVNHYAGIVRLDPCACDETYDAHYLSALRATTTCPGPFRRRIRFFNLVTLLRETLGTPGAIAECGCFRGLSSHLMCSTIKDHAASFTGDGYHIFDSFEGLSPPTLDDEIPEGFRQAKRLRGMTKTGHFAAPLELVRKNLAEFPKIAFHPGWIPMSFKGAPETPYRFVHLDVDLYDPTIESLEYFLPRMAPGGLIVSDDYNWPGARRAIDEFSGNRGINFTVTPHGQVVIRAG